MTAKREKEHGEPVTTRQLGCLGAVGAVLLFALGCAFLLGSYWTWALLSWVGAFALIVTLLLLVAWRER